MTTKKRLTDFIGLTEAQMDAAGTRVRAAEASGRDQFLHVRVDAELRARAVAAAESRGVTMSDYLRDLIESDLSAGPAELGTEVRDALHHLIDIYQRTTAT